MFREAFALTKQGAKDLDKGIFWSVLANISLVLPVCLIVLLIAELLAPLEGREMSIPNVYLFTSLAFIFLALIFYTHLRQYDATYTAAYLESANRRISLAEKLRQLPLSFFGRKNLSDLTNTMMGDCTMLEHTFSHAVPQLFGAIISITVMSVGLFFFEWRLSLAVFLAMPISLLCVIGSRKIQEHFSLKKIDAQLSAYDGVQECLETVKDLRSLGREDEYLANLDKKFDKALSAMFRSELVTGSFVSTGTAILRIGFACVILFGAGLLAAGEITFLVYLIFLLVASRIYDPLSTVFMQIAEIFEAQVRIRRMKSLESQPVQIGSLICEPNGYDIVFENVTFSYNEEEALKRVSFTAKQGEVTALVGPSGSGKSTAAKLAARFWDVKFGKISVGGVDVSTVDPEVLLKNFSIVFQDVVLFGNTIMENIRIGKEDATDDEVYAAAKAAQCESFISRLPDGYHTLIGENGATLSGGERQRISIARALLKNAPIILLDEATASLDVENETLIQSALSELVKNKTVLVIAHRMRTIAGADKIVVLESGELVEEGTHDTLLKEDGLYARLFDLQKRSVEWGV